MKPEELLKPRYKVIADYPGSPYSLGYVIELWYDTDNNAVVKGQMQFFGTYPHLFKKLEWWEDRKPEDMPEYVKSNYDNGSLGRGKVARAISWHKYDNDGNYRKSDLFTYVPGINNRICAANLLPITREEYETLTHATP